jgi:tetratricopeptide (TPR) repeat protein
MTDDIGAMTAQLAHDPTSLVFVPLAEALRKRGQLDPALTVAQRGIARYPDLADGHDLVARIQADRGQGDAAFDAWTTVLRLVPDHLGAHKGLAFLSYRAGDWARSLKHLTRALERTPNDPSLNAAAERVRRELAAVEAAQTRAPEPTPRSEEGSTLLFDQEGRVLNGSIRRQDGTDASDAVAACFAGVSQEAARAA